MADWTWFHRLGSPKWFYEKTNAWLPWLALLTAALLIVGTVWGLAFAPEDAKQGNSYRIIFIHVPSAFLALVCYYVMAIAGAIVIIWKMKLADMVMKSCATIGAALTFLALATGAIWGKPTWGTWWVWDARITSMLVLFFLYLGVIALREAFDILESASRASAILALVGTVNIPIIYKSVDWWNTLHQGASIRLTQKPTMPAEMYTPLFIMIIGFYLFFAVVLIANVRSEILIRERRTQWVQALVEQKAGAQQ